VRYRATIDPGRVSICHCTDCQMLTGSPFRVTVLTGRDDIEMTGGPKIYIKTSDNGVQRWQHFCPHCGSQLFASGPAPGDQEWGIRWGSVRQRSELPPARQIWCGSAASWIHDLADLPARPRGSNDDAAP
jgi:hypothetical protein